MRLNGKKYKNMSFLEADNRVGCKSVNCFEIEINEDQFNFLIHSVEEESSKPLFMFLLSNEYL